ncbi:hypothetical protein K1X84_12235 [bacterium]|nr:hypothetical protein [bacterium]
MPTSKDPGGSNSSHNVTTASANGSAKYGTRPKTTPAVLWWVLAVMLFIGGAFFAIIGLASILTGEYVGSGQTYTGDDKLSTLIGLFGFCGLIPMAFTGLIVFRLFRKKRQHEEEMNLWLESSILKFAALNQGKITAEETAMEFHIGVAQSKSILEEMVIKGIAELRVTDNGTLVYVFSGLNDDKESAENI